MRVTSFAILLCPVGLAFVSGGCGGGAECVSGAACVPENACHAGFLACGTGSPVCQDAHTNVASGTPCGTGNVCDDGACVACAAGATCTPEANLCHVGAMNCSTGAAVCRDTGRDAAAGTGCGVNRFCSASGGCGDCTQGKVCADGISPCHAGAIACGTGAPVCTDAGDLPEGTACAGGYCKAGVCTPCVPAGSACGNGGRCTADGACVLTVTGSARITYWPEGGAPTDVGNCYGQLAEAFTPNGQGGYTQLAPANEVCTATNSTFAIPGPVPAGLYLLHFAGSQAYGDYYLETTQPTLDFGRDQAGRPDANVVANDSTSVTFESTGLAPWAPGSDALDLVCGNVGLDLAVAGSAIGLADLAASATSGSSMVDWKAQPLVDAAKGDAAWLYQLVERPTGDAAQSYLTVARAARLADFSVADGVPLTAPAALDVVSLSGSIAITWATSQFEALAVQANPGYAPGAHFTSVDAVVDAVEVPAGAAKYAPSSTHVELLALRAEPGQPDLALGTLAYGQFLGAPWTEVVSTRFDLHAEYTAKGATSAATTYVGIYQQDPLPLAPPATIAPRLGPPLRPLVAGSDATVPQAGVTTSPELSWLSPSTGVPDFYEVAINDVTLDADGTSTDVATIASLLTHGTRIIVPPGVLASGHAYFAVIAALRTPDVAYDTAPLRLGLSTVRAETGTAIFTP